MDKEKYVKWWKTVQIILFFLPIIASLVAVPYQISYDSEYTEEVNPRVLDGGDGDFNVEGAVEDKLDTEGNFFDKKWKLRHKELYLVEAILSGFLIGLVLQILNVFWWLSYDLIKEHEEREEFERTYGRL
ncbi:MAG: hypothetical protein ACOC5T_06310 [Elusimicrobiota bacterium]